MARPKIPRKSTAIDMTAMCDVAFLLLSFFILTAKPKANEAITVTPPSSVASKKAPEKDVVLVSINSDGKVFISMDDKSQMEYIANSLNNTKNLGIDAKKFSQLEFIGVPFSGLARVSLLPKEQQNDKVLTGIPIDTTKGANEMVEWMKIIKEAYNGKKMYLLLKGDNVSKYPSFKGVISAFKKNDFLKFQMVTSPESVPNGTDLWRDNQRGQNASVVKE
ncbi:MAG: biopolymer transporter ExbD [Chitinophagaceae bacterium]|nr:biopolymer transporter ExbD [Chitinophagaceae bacterium]